MKDRFLSHVSHELRSPLTVIHQFVTIVRDGLAGDLNAEQREYLEIAVRNIGQLQTMIADLLEATRTHSGKLHVEPRPLRLQELVSEVMKARGADATARGISLHSDVPESLPSVQADPTRVRQILFNLLDNAVKFTPEAGSVLVTAAVADDEREAVRVSVRDTGCGLSGEAKEKVFDRLYQEATGSTDSRTGLGLGLYICKELVSLQNGRIWVESEPHHGSTFHFTLPFAPVAVAGQAEVRE